MPASGALEGRFSSVVKVMTVSDAADYDQPWQSRGPVSMSGSGSIVRTSRGLRVVTNAHCVEDRVFVKVRRYGQARKFVAEVEALGQECDLALLVVKDEAFFKGAAPIPLGGLPSLGDNVVVCGYPVGGDRLSITQGIVSRIELVPYAQSRRRLLAVQIDAAINSGNSGGPVLRGDELVGVAFQTLDDADKIGYVIAAPVVRHFLHDVDSGAYEGFPALGAEWQPLESEGHRCSRGLAEGSEQGVLITRVVYGGSAWGLLEDGDVLLEVDGVEVLPDGTVLLPEGMLDFEYILSRLQVGERCSVKVWRQGAERTLDLLLKPPRDLVAEEQSDVVPSYYVFAGLLFSPLTRNYLMTWGEQWWRHAPRELMAVYERGICTPDVQQPVVLQKVLADRVNQGYHDFESVLIFSAMGEQVRSLRHLVDLVEDSDEPFLEFVATDGQRIVVSRELAEERHEAILERFGVPQDRSADLTVDTDTDDHLAIPSIDPEPP